MSENYSPLRYPGGKSKLAPLIKYIISDKSDSEINTYIEPFAGGAGVALDLLLTDFVENIIINDYDKAVYSFWKAIITEPQRFIDKIDTTILNVDEWRRQKEIYLYQRNRYSFELGFATFYLNRTNRSGILTAGPIGGYEQNGNYLIDARFNKEALIERIHRIAHRRKNIKVYNKDIRSFIKLISPDRQRKSFIYFDPPYYVKGKELYRNFFMPKDHQKIHNDIKESIYCPWIMTYDNEKSIEELYSEYSMKEYELIYSLANKGKSSELIIFSSNSLCPSNTELEKAGLKIKLS